MDIWEAAGDGDLERLSVLVEQHAWLVTAPDADGQTPLFRAARYGHSGVVRYLLDAGADIHHRDHHRRTPLFEACISGHAGVVSVLLQRDVTAVHQHGPTALTIAAVHGRDAVVRVLLEHGGIDVDVCNNNLESTAMHCACSLGHAGVLRQLLEAGANPTLRDGDGRTPSDLAAAYGHHDCVRLIQEWDRAYQLQRIRRLADASLAPSLSVPQQGP